MSIFAVQGAAGPSASDVVWHFAYYAGIAGLIGIAIVARFVFDDAPRALARAAPVAWTLAAVGATALAWQAHNALKLGIGEFASVHLGRVALGRLIPLLVAYAPVFLAAARPARARRMLSAAGISAAVSALGHLFGSHAASGTFALGKLALQWVHVLAVGAWIGGLAALLLATRGEPAPEKANAAERFSAIAGVAIFAVGVTGLARALNETGSIGALVGTTYGRLIIAKSELLIALAILGAVNRYRHVPNARSTLAPLRRTGMFEIGIAVVVLALTGALSGTEPARRAAALSKPPSQVSVLRVQPGAYSVRFSDGHTVQLLLDPFGAGRAELHVTTIGPAGREVAIDSIRVEARAPDGRLSLPKTRRLTPGHHVLRLDLTPGRWRFTVRLGTADGARLVARVAPAIPPIPPR
jgi:copper transport protein